MFVRRITTGMAMIAVLAFLAGCGPKQDAPVQQISDAEQAIKASKDAKADSYAPELVKLAEDALAKAKAIVDDKDSGHYTEAQVQAVTARIYGEVAKSVSEARETADKSSKMTSQAKAAEAKARAEVQLVRSALEKAREVVPHLRTQIDNILKELEKVFEEAGKNSQKTE